MRALILLLTVCLALARTTSYMPPHIPVEYLDSNTTYAIPYWLGGFIATVDSNAVWTLPLTYLNGGKTPVGTTLVIENLGPANITLTTSSPESIQGSSTYQVPSGTTVSILSYTDWIVTSTPSVDSTSGQINSNTSNIKCWLNVGEENPSAQQCGDVGSKRVIAGNSNVDPWASIPNLGGYKFGSIGTWSNYSLDTDASCGQINEVSGYVENSGTCAAVAGFFFGRGNHVWGINEAAYSTCNTCTAIGNELDFGNLAANITRVTVAFTLPLAAGSDIAVTTTVNAPTSGMIIINTVTWFTYTSINDTAFLGVEYVEGTNTGTINVNSGVTYGIGGNAYGLVLVALGSNIGGSPPQNYIQLQGSKTLARNGIVFNARTTMPGGALIRAAGEKVGYGVNFLGSTFYGSALRVPVNSGSTTASIGLEILPVGGFANTGYGVLVNSLGDGSTMRYGFRVSASIGQPLSSVGTVLSATNIITSIGIDFTGATFSTAAIILPVSTTQVGGIWMGTDLKLFRSGVKTLRVGNSGDTNIEFALGSGGTIAASIYAPAGNIRLGSIAGTQLTTGTTFGFPKIPTITGVPVNPPLGAEASSAEIFWDKTNFKLCVYDQPTASWKCSAGYTMANEPDPLELHAQKTNDVIASMQKQIDTLEAKLAEFMKFVLSN